MLPQHAPHIIHYKMDIMRLIIEITGMPDLNKQQLIEQLSQKTKKPCNK